jgi:hypothetical protein
MTPSTSIMAASNATETILDTAGRQLIIRRLTVLDRLRLFKAAGPVLAQNQPWLGMALIASSVVAIDEVPVPPPSNEAQIEAMIARLGDGGVAAIATALQRDVDPNAAEMVEAAGN